MLFTKIGRSKIMNCMKNDALKQIYGFDIARNAWNRLEKINASKS